MPGIFEIQSTHYEGETIRTMARVVDLDQVMLTPDEGGDLTIKIQSRGVIEYTRTVPAGYGTGLLPGPATPDAWTKRGSVNMIFDHSAEALAAGSPSFRFKGGRSYLIAFDWDSVNHGHILGRHNVRILPSP